MTENEKTELNSACGMCKRLYPEPCEDLLCGECVTRCPVCFASNRGCINPDKHMMVLQHRMYNDMMTRHRRAGEELPWFELMDKMNQAATEPDPHDL
ncbi:MAG TPA: hypothetical protein V6C86_21955 [Oculatellaceae cyanobacterium]